MAMRSPCCDYGLAVLARHYAAQRYWPNEPPREPGNIERLGYPRCLTVRNTQGPPLRLDVRRLACLAVALPATTLGYTACAAGLVRCSPAGDRHTARMPIDVADWAPGRARMPREITEAASAASTASCATLWGKGRHGQLQLNTSTSLVKRSQLTIGGSTGSANLPARPQYVEVAWATRPAAPPRVPALVA
jgi:hypothetical protein